MWLSISCTYQLTPYTLSLWLVCLGLETCSVFLSLIRGLHFYKIYLRAITYIDVPVCKMSTFAKADRFPSTPKSYIPLRGSRSTPPSLVKLAREMTRQSSESSYGKSIPTPTPVSSAGHTPHPQAIPSNLREDEVAYFDIAGTLIYRKELYNSRSWWKFWANACVSKT